MFITARSPTFTRQQVIPYLVGVPVVVPPQEVKTPAVVPAVVEPQDAPSQPVFSAPVGVNWALSSYCLALCFFGVVGFMGIRRTARERQENVLSLTEFKMPQDLIDYVNSLKKDVGENKRTATAEEQSIVTRFVQVQNNQLSSLVGREKEWVMGDVTNNSQQMVSADDGKNAQPSEQAKSADSADEATAINADDSQQAEAVVPREDTIENSEQAGEHQEQKASDDKQENNDSSAASETISAEEAERRANEMLNGSTN